MVTHPVFTATSAAGSATRSRSPLRVVVAGGGVAAGELALALRALAEERVEVEIVSPTSTVPYRPAATASPFQPAPIQTFDLDELAADAGASIRLDSVEAVASRAKRLRLASGAHVTYDALVLAVGARARAAVPGAITFRDQRDAHLVTGLLRRVPVGGRVVLAAPAGVSWTLPLYELALLMSGELERRALHAEVTVVSHERRPLEVFGADVSEYVASLLADRGVRLLRGAARSAGRSRLTLTTGEQLDANGVIAVPRLTGRSVAGVPSDWNGFVPTDAEGRVDGLVDVYAAGDVTQFPIKQGGLATQQADVIAAVLAAQAGADVEPPSNRHVLRARLLGASAPCYLRAELDGQGRPLPPGDAPAVSDEADWWPATKLFGRHLSPWLAARAVTP